MFYSLYYQQESHVGHTLASDAKHSIPGDVMSDLSELTGVVRRINEDCGGPLWTIQLHLSTVLW